ncbi:MAG: hypothetical protein ACKV0T_26820 [Planctomycetales bacterium]
MSDHPPKVSPESGNRDASSGTEEAGAGAAAGPAPSNTGRKFPCPGCGAKLDFDPSQRALRCPYCNYSERIDPTDAQIQERDWKEYWQQTESRGQTIEGRSSEVQCRACAAVVLLEDKVATDKCPYCSNDLENRPAAAQNMILPEGILPFKIDQKQARQAFNQWIHGRWFAPNDFKHLADLGRLNGIYVPFWTFDSMTYTHYTGQRGDNYQEVVTYTEHATVTQTDSQGRVTTTTRPVVRTRVETRIRWSPASGNVEHFFDDVLVCASKSIPEHLMHQLEPWDIEHYEPFRPDFLAGFQTERYTVGLKDGFTTARGIMDGSIRTLCCRDIGGDHQQLHSVQTQHSAITFKHVLQPVWLAPYRYHQRLFQIAINARTGEVVGDRPYSFWKIALAVLVILGIVGLVALVGGMLQRGQGQSAPPPSVPLPAEAETTRANPLHRANGFLAVDLPISFCAADRERPLAVHPLFPKETPCASGCMSG